MTDLKRQFDEQHVYGVRPERDGADVVRAIQGRVNLAMFGDSGMLKAYHDDCTTLLEMLAAAEQRAQRLEVIARKHAFREQWLGGKRYWQCYECFSHWDDSQLEWHINRPDGPCPLAPAAALTAQPAEGVER